MLTTDTNDQPVAPELPKPSLAYFMATIADLQEKLANAQAQEMQAMNLRMQLQGAINLAVGQRNAFFPANSKSAPSTNDKPSAHE